MDEKLTGQLLLCYFKLLHGLLELHVVSSNVHNMFSFTGFIILFLQFIVVFFFNLHKFV